MARFELDFYAKHLARRVEVSLVLPSLNLQGALANQDPRYYQNRAAAFPLIVCLCGFGDNRKTWAANTEIEALCEQNGFAACFVNGENKWYLNLGPIDDHYSFLEEDLLDFLYGNFANLSSEAPLFLAGVSMGGYGALYHYLRNTEKYQGVVALSPATKPDFLDESKFGTLRDLFLAKKEEDLHVYLAIGEKDFIIGPSREFDAFLKENDVPARYRFVPGEDHSWSFWRKEIEVAFGEINHWISLGK